MRESKSLPIACNRSPKIRFHTWVFVKGRQSLKFYVASVPLLWRQFMDTKWHRHPSYHVKAAILKMLTSLANCVIKINLPQKLSPINLNRLHPVQRRIAAIVTTKPTIKRQHCDVVTQIGAYHVWNCLHRRTNHHHRTLLIKRFILQNKCILLSVPSSRIIFLW